MCNLAVVGRSSTNPPVELLPIHSLGTRTGAVSSDLEGCSSSCDSHSARQLRMWDFVRTYRGPTGGVLEYERGVLAEL